MRNISAVASVVLIVAGTFGCAKRRPPAEEYPPGESVFRRACQGCHSLPKPDEKTDDGWSDFLRTHVDQAGLTAEEQTTVIEYLRKNN